jgi:RNA polymerase sigma-70 factor (ECF subfamily)
MQNPATHSSAATTPGTPPPDPAQWVDEHGDALFRYAILRLKDEHLAEDLIQDTFLAALKGIERFKPGSSPQPWLIGILKHKIIDHFRRNVIEIPSADLNLWDDEDNREYFDKSDHWARPLNDWKESPEALVENAEFWETFQSCLLGLPESHRRAFTLRELDGAKGEEVCQILSISPSNMWVIMHRARSKLRKCLDARWFMASTEEKQ